MPGARPSTPSDTMRGGVAVAHLRPQLVGAVGVERRELVAHEVAGAVGQHHHLGATVALHRVERDHVGVRRRPRRHRLLLHRIAVHLGGEVVDAVLLAHHLDAEHDREHDGRGREQRDDARAAPRPRVGRDGGRVRSTGRAAAAARRGRPDGTSSAPSMPAHNDVGRAYVAAGGQERHRLAQRLDLGTRASSSRST